MTIETKMSRIICKISDICANAPMVSEHGQFFKDTLCEIEELIGYLEANIEYDYVDGEMDTLVEEFTEYVNTRNL